MNTAFVPLMQLIARAGTFEADTAELRAACHGLWERDLLTICPPGHRYKLSALGRAELLKAVQTREAA